MNVIVLNGSPLVDQGTTAMILHPFAEGMKEAGAQVTIHCTRQLNIEPCLGEHHCWYKHPGRCSLEDDMQPLYGPLQAADLWVLGTPVYADSMTGPLKNVMDRLVALVQPFFEIRDRHCRHPVVEKREGARIALVATAGFWELDNFSPLLGTVRGICRNIDRSFAGSLLRPHSQAFKPLLKRGALLDDLFEASREAGRQVVRKGEIAPDTAQTVSRMLMTREEYVAMINDKFTRLLELHGHANVQ